MSLIAIIPFRTTYTAHTFCITRSLHIVFAFHTSLTTCGAYASLTSYTFRIYSTSLVVAAALLSLFYRCCGRFIGTNDARYLQAYWNTACDMSAIILDVASALSAESFTNTAIV